MYGEYAEFLSSQEATVKTAREFWKELDWKEMGKGSLVGSGRRGSVGGGCGSACCGYGGCAIQLSCVVLLETPFHKLVLHNWIHCKSSLDCRPCPVIDM